MAIERWNPRSTYTKQEEWLLARLKRTRKLFGFLREHRAELFDDEFQAELETMYRATGAGKPPLPPAFMAMVTLIQGYVGASDAEAVELTVVDLRWQLVLGLLGVSEPAFSQGALHDFRHRLIKHDMDRRLLERTRELARRTMGFDYKKLPKTLRVAVDSAPLEGAGRVEDTLNLLGHAARKVVECAAVLLEIDGDDVAREAGIPLLLASSIKRGLDRSWTEPGAREAAVEELVRQIASLQHWLSARLSAELEHPALKAHVDVLDQIIGQDLEPTPGDGSRKRIRDGVAEDRRISIEDGEMRHGRKSSSKRIDGYKRHIAKDLDDGLVMACALKPANAPEQEALTDLNNDIEAQDEEIDVLYIDRGYISSPLVSVLLARGGKVVCRPWRQGNGELFSKEEFTLDFESMTITCPSGHARAMKLGSVAVFPAEVCRSCALRLQCTRAKSRGRSVQIGENEPLQQELRESAKTSAGRDELRKRVPVEHELSHVVQRQGKRARYNGVRNNLYDLRRAAAIGNLEAAHRAANSVAFLERMVA